MKNGAADGIMANQRSEAADSTSYLADVAWQTMSRRRLFWLVALVVAAVSATCAILCLDEVATVIERRNMNSAYAIVWDRRRPAWYVDHVMAVMRWLGLI